MGTIEIGAATDEINDGVDAYIPPGMRPGIFPGGGDTQALRAQFLALGGVAAWRCSFDDFNVTGGARSWAQLQSQIAADIALGATGSPVGQALSSGVPCLISNAIAPPSWLRTSTGDSKTGPMSLSNMYQYGYYVVKAALSAAIANGYDPLLLLWDLENESEDTTFSSVNYSMMLRLWSAYRKGAKDAGAELGLNPPVGGMQFHEHTSNVIASSLGPGRYPETAVSEFLRYCKSPPADDAYALNAYPDFISIHLYSTGFFPVGANAIAVRRQMQSIGAPDTIPIYIGECSWHGSFSITNVARDREEGAASLVMNHKYLADSGVKGACHLQIAPNTGTITFPDGYGGQWGIVKFTTTGTVPLRNGCYIGYMMMARLLARRIASSVTASDRNRGVEVIASSEGGNRAIVICRYQREDPSDVSVSRMVVFIDYMTTILGYEKSPFLVRELDFSAGLTRAEITAYCGGTSSGQITSGALPSYFTGKPGALAGHTLDADCAAAKAAAVEFGAQIASDTSVTISIPDAAVVTAWRRCRISSASIVNNPHRAYIAEAGADEATAIAAATAQQEDLTAEATGTDGSAFPMNLTVTPNEVILLEIDAPDPQSVAGTLVPWVSVGSTSSITTHLRYRSAQDDYTLQVTNTSVAVVEALIVLPLAAYAHGRIQRIDDDTTIRGTWEPYVRSHVLPATFNMSRLKITLRAKQRQTYRFTR